MEFNIDTNTVMIYEFFRYRNMEILPKLITERLTLRPLAESDAQKIFLLRSDILINKYLDRMPCNSLADAVSFIQRIRKGYHYYWAIVTKGKEELAGTICLYDLSEDEKRCGIGFELFAEFQGKGIMKEAATRIIEYSFHALGVKTIDAYTHKENKRSINLLIALKFIYIDPVDGYNPNLTLFRLTKKAGLAVKEECGTS